MANDKTILITGATGKQGGATLRHLTRLGGFKLRALTRKPDGDAAKAVAALGAEVVAGDFDDAASLERAVAGALLGRALLRRLPQAAFDRLVMALTVCAAALLLAPR